MTQISGASPASFPLPDGTLGLVSVPNASGGYDSHNFPVATNVVSVKDFAAAGNNVTDDTAAFVSATAYSRPVYVPVGTSYYLTTGLTTAQKELLYGPGLVKDGGTALPIPSSPQGLGSGAAGQLVQRMDLQPSQWSGVQGSIRNGLAFFRGLRSGGYGSYGLLLVDAAISAALPSTQFDSGITTWVTARNLTGGSVFGAWLGANTPSASLSQTYSSGSAIGAEINVGNRWGDAGKQTTLGGTRYTVGLQIVPDVIPASDGTTAAIYPGTFGLVLGQSVSGHKWWTGMFVPYDTIVATGDAVAIQGGASAPNAPASAINIAGYFTNGIDFSGSAVSNAIMKFGFAHVSGGATAGGGIAVPATVNGFIIIDIGGSLKRVPYFNP